MQIEDLQEAVVLARESEDSQNELCAYIVSEKEWTVAQLRAELSDVLPTYMIPSHFVQVGKLPLTPNGKIDRKALLEQSGNLCTGIAYVEPRSITEWELAGIWEEILGLEKVGLHDRFFDLGGHSLRAMTLVARIHQKLDVEITVRDVFQYPTLEALANVVAVKKKKYMRRFNQCRNNPIIQYRRRKTDLCIKSDGERPNGLQHVGSMAN